MDGNSFVLVGFDTVSREVETQRRALAGAPSWELLRFPQLGTRPGSAYATLFFTEYADIRDACGTPTAGISAAFY
jgi:hypothetical protein